MASLFATQKKLRDDLFCITEERNYFHSKYLEQVSEITAMKTELSTAQKEIRRLRERLMMMDSGGNGGGFGGENAAAAASLTPVSDLTTPDLGAAAAAEHCYDDFDVEEKKFDVYGDESQQHQHHNNKFNDRNGNEEEEEDNDDGGGDDDDDDAEEEEEEDITIRQNAAKLLQWANYRTSMSPKRGNSFNSSSSIGGGDENDNEGSSHPPKQQHEDDADAGVDDSRIRDLYQEYCEKLKEIRSGGGGGEEGRVEEGEVPNTLSEGSSSALSSASSHQTMLMQLMEEANSILQQMSIEVDNLPDSCSTTAATTSIRSEWQERIALYRGQLRIQSM